MARLVPLVVQRTLGNLARRVGWRWSKETIRQQRCLEVASRPRHVLPCFNVVDESRRTYRHHGRQRDAPRRIATFPLRNAARRTTSLRNARTAGDTRRFSRVLAQTVTLNRLWYRDGHVLRTHSFNPDPGTLRVHSENDPGAHIEGSRSGCRTQNLTGKAGALITSAGSPSWRPPFFRWPDVWVAVPVLELPGTSAVLRGSRGCWRKS